MTIKAKVPIEKTDNIGKFIQAAPDSGAGRESDVATGVIRGRKQVITVGITLDLMPRLNAAADRLYLSRAAFINMAIRRALEETER